MLFLPPTGFAKIEHNLAATPGGTVWGTTITGAGTAHTKGAYSAGQLIASTTYDTHLMVLGIAGTSASATRTDALLDIGVGGSGSETTIISNLLAGWVGNGTTSTPRLLYLPIYIPAGSRIAARAQGVQTSKAVEVALWLFQGPSRPPWRTYQGMDAYGVTDSGASTGTSHTPGNTGAESAWANIGGTTSRDYDALFFMAQGTLSDTNTTAVAYHWEIGWSSTALAEFYWAANASEFMIGPLPAWPVFHPVPSGTQLQVRGECSGTAEATDVAIYGLY